MYKEITVTILISILILLSFIGSSEAIYLNNDLSDLKTMISSSILKSDKHPVFVEYFTQKNNPDNPIISNHLYNLFADLYPYSSEDCDFYFITLLTDVVEEAEKRALDYNIQNYPVVFFDGGFEEINGVQNTIESYHNAIDSCKTTISREDYKRVQGNNGYIPDSIKPIRARLTAKGDNLAKKTGETYHLVFVYQKDRRHPVCIVQLVQE